MNKFLTHYAVGLAAAVGATLLATLWVVMLSGFGSLFWLYEHGDTARFLAFVVVIPAGYATSRILAKSRR